MPAAKLSAATMQAALDAVQAHGGIAAAAKALGIPRATLQARHQRACLWQAERGAGVVSTRLPVTADECWAVIDDAIGRKRLPKTKPPTFTTRPTQRIVVAGDFHAPYHDVDAVAELIAREAGQTDLLVISGDFLDLYSVSRFEKRDSVSIYDEWAAGEALLAALAAKFPDILMIHGNHDQRIERQLRAVVQPELAHAVEILTGGNFSLLRLLAKRHPNVRISDHRASDAFSIDWFCQVGDLLVSHAEKFSKVPAATLRQVDEGMTEFDHVYGLTPWRVLIQAHTHAHSVTAWKADRLLVEGGAMCKTHGYQMTPRMGGRPQRQGYVTLTQTDGKTDINSVRFRWLNSERKSCNG